MITQERNDFVIITQDPRRLDDCSEKNPENPPRSCEIVLIFLLGLRNDPSLSVSFLSQRQHFSYLDLAYFLHFAFPPSTRSLFHWVEYNRLFLHVEASAFFRNFCIQNAVYLWLVELATQTHYGL